MKDICVDTIEKHKYLQRRKKLQLFSHLTLHYLNGWTLVQYDWKWERCLSVGQAVKFFKRQSKMYILLFLIIKPASTDGGEESTRWECGHITPQQLVQLWNLQCFLPVDGFSWLTPVFLPLQLHSDGHLMSSLKITVGSRYPVLSRFFAQRVGVRGCFWGRSK